MKVAWVPVLLMMLLLGCNSEPDGNAEIDRSRVIPPLLLMRSLVYPHFEALQAGLLVEIKTDEHWDVLSASAALLHEASFMLMRNPPSDDDAWSVAASRMLRDGSQSISTAIRGRDQGAAKTAFLEMRDACNTCHRECPADLAEVTNTR